MNGTKMFSFKGASPLKPVNSTSDSSLIIGHKTGIAITNTVKKRFYGVSNRDASSIIARKTSQNIAKILNDPVQRNTASDTVNKRDVYTALTRVRNKGNIIPAKVNEEIHVLPNAPTITGGDRDFGQLTIYFNAGEENQFPVENYAYSLNNGEFILFDPVDIDSPLYITSGLANGTTYTIHIAAVSYYGMGASSNPITLTTFDVPAAPTNLNKYSISASDAIITFTAGYNGGTLITNYEYKLNGGQWIALSPADASSPITITGLSPSTTYSLLLRAVNGVGAGAQSSNAINFTTMSLGGAAPSPPTLTYLLADDGQAYVYFIQGDTNGSTIIDTEFSKDGGMNWISMGGIDQPLLATGLTNGVVQSIIIRMKSNNGYSIASNAINVTPVTGVVKTATLYYDAENYITDSSYITNAGDYHTGMTGTLNGVTIITDNTIKVFNFAGSYISFGQYNFGILGSFTISAWVKPFSKISINGLIANTSANQAPNGFKVGWNNWNEDNRTMYGEYGNGTIGNADATVVSTVTYNSWQHLSYIIDITNKVIMYLKNGVPVKTSSISDNIIPANVGTNNANFNIGAFIGGTYNMLAYMKYIKVYNIASSVSEIKADYDASKSIFGL